MNRTTMSYMVATLVSLAALGTLITQPTLAAATTRNSDTSTADPTSGSSATTNPACGQVVSGNVTLTSNLNCSGDGLIVGDDNTVINMNGYTIAGPGRGSSKVGIMIPASAHVEVKGAGQISNFQAGVLATGSSDVKVSRLILTENQIATFLTGTRGTTVSENIMDKNTIAVAAHSARNADIESNVMDGNALAGATFVNSLDSTIAGNNIRGSNDGIFLDPQSHNNVVNSNIAKQNTEDINNGNGLPVNINNNDFKDNLCTLSTPSGLCTGGQ
ncbi:MAG: NosD domain-containing protein [Nitrososphaeraceae archaeon]|jgi:parallel beta-helix repeat protein